MVGIPGFAADCLCSQLHCLACGWFILVSDVYDILTKRNHAFRILFLYQECCLFNEKVFIL